MAVDQRFRSLNFRNHFIRHRNFLGELTPEDGPIDDFAFKLIGRDGLVRMRSRNFPTRFLRHRDFRVHLEGPGDPNSQLFVQDSTFRMLRGLADPNGISFESVNVPGHFIRHRNFHLFLEPRQSPNLAADATFFQENAPVKID
jgi:Alpha-L-arabinofuranosidase B (ABFB) domain